MIVDRLENTDLYTAISPRISKGLKFLRYTDFTNLQDGKHEIDNDDLFFLIQRYPTNRASDVLFEAHRNYIDIQAIIKGEEIIGYSHVNKMGRVIHPYESDAEKYADPQFYSELRMSEGMFAIFFPHDAHKPGYHRNDINVIKVIVKVKL